MHTLLHKHDSPPVPHLDTARSTRWMLIGLCLSMLMSALGTSIANVALPTLAQAFRASFPEVQWVVLAYLLTITTLIVSVGRIGDLVGHRRLLLSGIFLFTSASIVCGVAPSLPWLIAARAAQGLGAAIMMALTMAFVSGNVPKEKTGSVIGLLGTMSAVGTALGPSLGGVLIATFSWRANFLIQAPFGALAFAIALRHLPEDRPKPPGANTGFDPLGTLLLAVALAAYTLSMTLGRGQWGHVNLVLVLVAVFTSGLFVFSQTQVKSPLIRLTLFRDRSLGTSLIMSLLVSTVMMATMVVGPFYLTRAVHLDPAQVGLTLSLGPLVAAFTSAPAGRLADRIGVGRMTLVGLGGIGLGALHLTIMPSSLGVWGYLFPVVVITLGYAFFQTANNTSVMAGVSQDQRGVISAMLNLSRNLGLISGASVMGAIFAFAAGTSEITTATPEAVASGMHVTFSVVLGLMAVALTMAFRMAPSHRKDSRALS